jgi:hypothetical protein
MPFKVEISNNELSVFLGVLETYYNIAFIRAFLWAWKFFTIMVNMAIATQNPTLAIVA